MLRKIVLLRFFLFLIMPIMIMSIAYGQQLTLRITEPSDTASVPERPDIIGTVSVPSATVWVVTHPMEISEYWIQPSVTVKEDGSWKVKIYIGRPGSADVGKHFEIMAIANPKESLQEGKYKEKKWPEAQAKSQVIEVTRK